MPETTVVADRGAPPVVFAAEVDTADGMLVRERHERNLHLKRMIALADRRMRRGEAAAAAAGWCEQVGTEPSRAQSQAPSNAPVTASQPQLTW